MAQANRHFLPQLPAGDEWVMIDVNPRRLLLGWTMDDDMDKVTWKRKAGTRSMGVSQFGDNVSNVMIAASESQLHLAMELYRRFRSCGVVISPSCAPPHLYLISIAFHLFATGKRVWLLVSRLSSLSTPLRGRIVLLQRYPERSCWRSISTW
jgi:hypothetical protein